MQLPRFEINACGLVADIPFYPSPNCDERKPEIQINLLVIHGISLPPKEFGGNGINALFLNQLNFDDHPYFAQLKELRVSSHLLIRRDAQVIQYVPFTKRAWHAGISKFADRTSCNDFSIGIELEGTDDVPYTLKQYEHLAGLTLTLMHIYSDITLDRIVGHSEIAPGRKTDPGTIFDWYFFQQLLIQGK